MDMVVINKLKERIECLEKENAELFENEQFMRAMCAVTYTKILNFVDCVYLEKEKFISEKTQDTYKELVAWVTGSLESGGTGYFEQYFYCDDINREINANKEAKEQIERVTTGINKFKRGELTKVTYKNYPKWLKLYDKTK